MPVTKILIANRGDVDPSAIERSEGAVGGRSLRRPAIRFQQARLSRWP